MESNTVEVYLLREIMPGYLWLFPIGNGQVNIGIGMRLDRYKKSSIDLKSLLMDFIMRDEIRERFSKKPEIFHLSSWPLLLASQKSIKRAYNGALLIGDAGAWIDPLTGGGICNALITGKIAGDVAAKALNQNTAKSTYLQNYEKMAKSRIGKEIRRSYIIQRSLGIFPNIVDPLIKWAGRSDILVNAANRMYQDLHIWRVNESNPTV
jgi:flavin-dependent dehydrogenase